MECKWPKTTFRSQKWPYRPHMDPVVEPIFTKMIPCPGVGILKMIPCSAGRPRTEKYISAPPPGYYLRSVNCILHLCVICCTSPRLYFCTAMHNCSNAGVRYDVTCWYSKAPFTRDRIQMGSDPFGSDPLFEGRLHGIGSIWNLWTLSSVLVSLFSYFN